MTGLELFEIVSRCQRGQAERVPCTQLVDAVIALAEQVNERDQKLATASAQCAKVAADWENALRESRANAKALAHRAAVNAAIEVVDLYVGSDIRAMVLEKLRALRDEYALDSTGSGEVSDDEHMTLGKHGYSEGPCLIDEDKLPEDLRDIPLGPPEKP